MTQSTSETGKRRCRRRGMLTFEWILLISLLVIGIIGGLAAVRNALICELNDLTGCIEAIACGDDDSCGQAGGNPPGHGGSGDGWWDRHDDDHDWGDHGRGKHGRGKHGRGD